MLLLVMIAGRRGAHLLLRCILCVVNTVVDIIVVIIATAIGGGCGNDSSSTISLGIMGGKNSSTNRCVAVARGFPDCCGRSDCGVVVVVVVVVIHGRGGGVAAADATNNADIEAAEISLTAASPANVLLLGR